MKETVNQYVESYEVCQRNKGENVHYPGLLQPLPITDQAWRHISLDFIEGLPKFRGKDVILVMVDRMTKFAHFITLSHPYTAPKVARKFLKRVHSLHEFPDSIFSDRERIFLSHFWQEFFKLVGTQLKFSTGYHPETDGQTERVNRCIESYLRCMTSHRPVIWE